MYHTPSRKHVCVSPSGSAATTEADLQNRAEGFKKLSLQRGFDINSPRSVGQLARGWSPPCLRGCDWFAIRMLNLVGLICFDLWLAGAYWN